MSPMSSQVTKNTPKTYQNIKTTCHMSPKTMCMVHVLAFRCPPKKHTTERPRILDAAASPQTRLVDLLRFGLGLSMSPEA